MIITLLIKAPINQPSRHLTALRYVIACYQRRHQIAEVFFLDEAVQFGIQQVSLTVDGKKLQAEWLALAKQHRFKLTLCANACEHFGVETRNGKFSQTVVDGFTITSLLQYFASCGRSGKQLVFG